MRLDGLRRMGITALAAAKFHSAAVTGDGQLLTWGWGRGGRLGDPLHLCAILDTTTNKQVHLLHLCCAVPMQIKLTALSVRAVTPEGTAWTMLCRSLPLYAASICCQTNDQIRSVTLVT